MGKVVVIPLIPRDNSSWPIKVRVFKPFPSLTMSLAFIFKRGITVIPSVVRRIKE